jgi:hypothetical protein
LDFPKKCQFSQAVALKMAEYLNNIVQKLPFKIEELLFEKCLDDETYSTPSSQYYGTETVPTLKSVCLKLKATLCLSYRVLKMTLWVSF